MLTTNDVNILKREITILREELDKIKEENLQLKSLFLPQEWVPPAEFYLTPHQRVLLGILYKNAGDVVTKTRMLDIVYGLKLNDKIPDLKIIDVFIHHIRKKVETYDIKIETVWGQGYVLTKDSGVILDNWGKEDAETEELVQ